MNGRERVCFQCCETAGPGVLCQRCGHRPEGDGPDDAMRLLAGSIVRERYLVGRELGRGGFGITYLARDLQLKVRVAVKEYYPRSTATRSRDGVTVQPMRGNGDAYRLGLESFIREAQMVSQLRSAPNVVTIYDVFAENGTGYMVMEYIQGVTLQGLLVPGNDGVMRPLEERDALPVAIAALDGLCAVHSVRDEQDKVLIHRDIKPANIMVSKDGPVVLLDFGAARYTTGSASQSLSEVLTVGYAPPEQYDPRAPQDERTDVYALGATLWTVLAGEPPVDGLLRQAGRRLPPLKEVARVSVAVSDAVERAMSLDAAKRFPTARDFQRALRGEQLPVPPRPTPAPDVVPAPSPVPPQPTPARVVDVVPGPVSRTIPRRDWTRPALVGLTVVVVAGGLFLGTNLVDRSSGEAPGLELQSHGRGEGAAASVSSRDPNHGYVRLPSGSYEMGSATGDSDERPVRVVQIRGFELAKSETTVGDYRRCVEAGPCTAPGTWGSCNWGRSGREDHPVNCVDWKQAKTYCEWAGARLPSEAEWEYAARSGGRDQDYPWGPEKATCARAVMNDGGGNGCGRGDSTWDVCSKGAANSAQGACDLAGNVWEWVEDTYHGSYDGAPVDGSAWVSGGSDRVKRGGGFYDVASYLRASDRVYHAPSYAGGVLGFRCSRSLAP
ncbi:MAG: hypothetical protein AMXMBFR64_23800 [Myxococcales bacterium]